VILFPSILCEFDSAAGASSSNAGLLASIPRSLPREGDLLGWCQHMSPGVAALLVMVGIVYLLFGFQIFKILVLLNAAIFGGFAGACAGGEGESAVAAALIGAVLAAAIAWPTMKYAVALMGGLFGGLLGASIWHAIGLDPNVVWAGAIIGVVALGLLSFVLFRGSVMMYTSLQGSFMLVFGILGLICKYAEVETELSGHLAVRPFLLPGLIVVPAVLGLVYQQHSHTTAAPPPKK
jgi:hypothetical protein